MKGPIIYMFFLALLALLAGSCGPARVVTGDIQRDSVYLYVRDSVITHDTIILAPIPRESDKAILRDTDTSRLQTSLAESEAFVKDGRLHHTLRNRSELLQPVRVQYKDKARVSSESRALYHKIIETVEVEKQLNGLQKTVMTLGWALIIAAVLWVVWKVSKIFI